MEKGGYYDKFRLLDSQENAAEINWSSSDSSDCENVSTTSNRNCLTSNTRCRKRKRKKKLKSNVSNLDIKIVEPLKDNSVCAYIQKSPILALKTSNLICEKSPILPASLHFPPNSSPVFSVEQKESKIKSGKISPILSVKRKAPYSSPNVRKHLFKNTSDVSVTKTLDMQSEGKSKVPDSNKICDMNLNNNLEIDTIKKEISLKTETIFHTGSPSCHRLEKRIKLENVSESESIEESLEPKTPIKIKLAHKIKSYFDNLNSDSSQPTISDCLTPKESKNGKSTDSDIEIVNSLSQTVISHIKKEQSTSSENSNFEMERVKRIKYKKNGLAFRLNILLKKQKASLSLWQHERYLALNSNFPQPSENERMQLYIFKVDFSYNCYLLRVKDKQSIEYYVLINNSAIVNINSCQCAIAVDKVFVLYKPYKIINCNNNIKIITNVSKFECDDVNPT